MAWVHPDPCDVEAEYGTCHHDEHHLERDDCLHVRNDANDLERDWYNQHPDAHFLQYERVLDVPYSFADDFDSRVGRLYQFADTDS